MAAEGPNGEVVTQGECTDCGTNASSESSFDELARGLADGTLSRRRALRLLGGALVGASLASFPAAAWAACKHPFRKCTANRQCCSRRCIRNPQGNGRICGCPTGQTLCPAGNQCVTCTNSGEVVDLTTCKCECPTGTELCGGQCVSSCTGGEVLDPTTCQCGPTACPEVSCCCVCNYQNPVTGDYVYICNTTYTTITLEQCYQSCQSATPPPGTILLPNHGYACESGSSGRQRVCLPEPPGGNSTGTFCSVVQCAPSSA
jgi:hypothetical protein